MSTENYWHDTEWQSLLYKLHLEMLEENAIYEKIADKNELSEGEIDEFFNYHRQKE